MSSFESPTEDLDLGVAYYADPAHYVPFSTYDDGRIQRACVDSRDTDQPTLTVDLHGPGGSLGQADDQAITYAALQGEVLSLTEALDREISADNVTVPGAHQTGCKWALGYQAVHEYMASPSAQDGNDIEAWGQYFFASVRDADWAFTRAQAGLQLNALHGSSDSQEKLVAAVAEATPVDRAVPAMVGPNKAGVYVVNFLANLGIDRQPALRGNNPLPVTAYNDNLGAEVKRLPFAEGSPERTVRTAVRILRTLATRRAVAADLAHLEVSASTADESSLRIVRTA